MPKTMPSELEPSSIDVCPSVSGVEHSLNTCTTPSGRVVVPVFQLPLGVNIADGFDCPGGLGQVCPVKIHYSTPVRLERVVFSSPCEVEVAVFCMGKSIHST